MRRKVTGAVLLSVLLIVGSTVAVWAQDEAERDEAAVSMADVSVAALFRALGTAPELLWPDATVPASLAEFVPAAREFMRDRAIDTFRWPLHLRLLEARCNDEGAVALIFEEMRPLFPWRTYAVAWGGSMPTSIDDGWGGGTGLTSVLDDSEFVHVMGTDTVLCP